MSALADWMSTTWCGPSANLECRAEMCCTRLAGNAGRKKSPNICHLGTIAQLCWAISSQLRHVLTIRKNLLNSNISSTCPHNIVNFGPLVAEICWQVWGTPANFNGFQVLAALLHSTQVVGVSQTLRRWAEGATYSAGWPSRWALAHILVVQKSSCEQTSKLTNWQTNYTVCTDFPTSIAAHAMSAAHDSAPEDNCRKKCCTFPFFSGWPWPLTLTFEFGRDFCTEHLNAKLHHPKLNHSEVIVWTNKQSDKQMPLKTSTSLRYATLRRWVIICIKVCGLKKLKLLVHLTYYW